MSDTPEKEWWEPVVKENGQLNWLCDHEGDFQEKADRLWKEYTSVKREVADLRAALEKLVDNVQDYEAWQRPCHALDVAIEALKGKP